MTWNGAWVSFTEREKGRLIPGQLADLVVLDRDIFAVDAEEIREARADLTVVGGVVAHDRTGESTR